MVKSWFGNIRDILYNYPTYVVATVNYNGFNGNFYRFQICLHIIIPTTPTLRLLTPVNAFCAGPHPARTFGGNKPKIFVGYRSHAIRSTVNTYYNAQRLPYIYTCFTILTTYMLLHKIQFSQNRPKSSNLKSLQAEVFVPKSPNFSFPAISISFAASPCIILARYW